MGETSFLFLAFHPMYLTVESDSKVLQVMSLLAAKFCLLCYKGFSFIVPNVICPLLLFFLLLFDFSFCFYFLELVMLLEFVISLLLLYFDIIVRISAQNNQLPILRASYLFAQVVVLSSESLVDVLLFYY